jgi:hypothetical protein
MKDEELHKKLDMIIGLLAIQNKERDQQITILNSLGFSSITIGKLLAIDDSTVRKFLLKNNSKKSIHKKNKSTEIPTES